jgi:hypothetical protein
MASGVQRHYRKFSGDRNKMDEMARHRVSLAEIASFQCRRLG